MIFMIFMSGKNRQVKVTYVNYRDEKSQKRNGSSILQDAWKPLNKA